MYTKGDETDGKIGTFASVPEGAIVGVYNMGHIYRAPPVEQRTEPMPARRLETDLLRDWGRMRTVPIFGMAELVNKSIDPRTGAAPPWSGNTWIRETPIRPPVVPRRPSHTLPSPTSDPSILKASHHKTAPQDRTDRCRPATPGAGSAHVTPPSSPAGSTPGGPRARSPRWGARGA